MQADKAVKADAVVMAVKVKTVGAAVRLIITYLQEVPAVVAEMVATAVKAASAVRAVPVVWAELRLMSLRRTSPKHCQIIVIATSSLRQV